MCIFKPDYLIEVRTVGNEVQFGIIDCHSVHGKVEFVSNEKINLAQGE